MNIFITGGTGFLGEHLISALQAEGGHTLYGLARSEASAKTLEARGVSPVRADLTDGDALRNALKPLAIEAVFHLAAEIATQRSKSKLRSANIDSTQCLYEAVRSHDELKTFVFASVMRSARTSNAKLKGLGWNPQYPDYKSGLAEALGSSTS